MLRTYVAVARCGVALFSDVHLYPPTGFPHELMGERERGSRENDIADDAILRASRPVSELYSEALRPLGVQGIRSGLRFSLRVPRVAGADRVEVTVWRAKPHDIASEWGFLGLPPSARELGTRDRALLVLDSIHAGVLQLADHRGWDPAPFAACHAHVLDHDLVYRQASPWKTSRDRRHQARAVYRLTADDGWGRAWIEVRDRHAEEVVGTSPEAVAFCTSAGFRRSSATLGWEDSATVRLTPYSGIVGADLGRIVGVRRGDTWEFEVRNEVGVRQPDVRVTLPGVVRPPVVVVPDEE